MLRNLRKVLSVITVARKVILKRTAIFFRNKLNDAKPSSPKVKANSASAETKYK